MKTKFNFKKIALKSAMALLLLTGNPLFSQDRITLKSGEEMEVIVTEITDRVVKYKDNGNPDGPLRVIARSDIFMIRYSNGKKEMYNSGEQSGELPQMYSSQPAHTNNDRFDPDTSDFAKKKRKNFSGPRIGFSYITPGTTADFLSNNNLRPSAFLFGWQFEGRLFTTEDGTSGFVAFVPMLGGIDQGQIFPSANFFLGLRGGTIRSWEFAVGPHFGLKYDHNERVQGAVGLVMAVGMSFKKGNVWFPVNLAVVPSVGSLESVEIKDANGAATTEKQKFQTGWKISLTTGFNSRRR